jgi:diphthamide biosynthesis protein 7
MHSSNIIQNLSTPSAILDIHFLTHIPSPTFGVATSTGSIALYELLYWEKNAPIISHIKTIQYFPQNVLVTSFQWHPESYMVGMTLSDGRVCLGIIEGEGEDEDKAMQIAKHELEAWILAFLPDGSGILSGGDDSALKMIELSEHDDKEDVLPGNERYAPARYMPWSDKKVHGAGVTAILPLHVDDSSTLVVTGSYDDSIRLLSISPTGSRKCLADLNLGGGVWRIKLLDRNPSLPANHAVEKWRSEPSPTALLLLVSCMHAGTRVVRLEKKTGEEWVFKVLKKFEEHESMNYGSDCQPGVNKAGKRTVVSTSFYDRLLCLWRF